MKKNNDDGNFFKLLLIGDSAVGKTSLIDLYTKSSVNLHQKSTIACEYSIKSELVDGKTVKLLIWDSAGQEKYRAITRTFYSGARGILVVYSVIDRTSFNNVKRWIDEIVNTCDNFSLILIGNKADLNDQRVISFEEGHKLAKE